MFEVVGVSSVCLSLSWQASDPDVVAPGYSQCVMCSEIAGAGEVSELDYMIGIAALMLAHFHHFHGLD